MTGNTLENTFWLFTILLHYYSLYGILGKHWMAYQLENIALHSPTEYLSSSMPEPAAAEWRADMLKISLINRIRSQVGFHTLTLVLNWMVLLSILYIRPHAFTYSVELVSAILFGVFLVSAKCYTENALYIDTAVRNRENKLYEIGLDVQYRLNVRMVKILHASLFFILQVCIYVMTLPQAN